MNPQSNNPDETWADLVPVQPKRRDRWVVWAVGGGALAAIVCLCAVLVFFIAREFRGEPATSVAAPPVPTAASTSPALVTSESSLSSPAATVPGQATTASEASRQPASTATIEPAATSETDTEFPPSVFADRLASPPLIDGQLAEWPDLPIYRSAFRVFAAPSWDGTEDLDARWRLGWDEANLYIGVEVRDDTHVQTQSGNQLFRGDSVDIQFDTDRLGDFGPQLSPDDFQITLSPGDFGALPPSAFRFRGTEAGTIIDDPGHNVILAAEAIADGYTLEAAIPWSNLSLSPAIGLTIGLALNANDNDTPGTAVQEVMMSHVASRTLTDPTGWGTLTLR